MPAGYVAQPMFRFTDDDGLCFEMTRVFDRAGRVDEDRSYWSVAQVSPEPYGVGPFPVPRTLSFGLVRQAFDKVNFRSFVLPSARTDVLRWMTGPERPPAGIGGLQRA